MQDSELLSSARLGFAGTPEFAATALRHLLAIGVRPELVLTQPDRPAGRGRKLRASPVKALALDEGLRVEQPKTLKSSEIVDGLGLDALDLLIVAAYGLILPQPVLDAPRLGCVNIHASLLPRWRGAAPIVWAIAEGDSVSGVCLMQMEAGLDTGPVLAEQRTPIQADETAADLHDRLAQLGGNLLVHDLPDILRGALDPQVQDHENATYARKLVREDGVIDWGQPAVDIDRRIRAFNPYPGCVARLDDEPVKIWRSVLGPADRRELNEPGKVLNVGADGIEVGCLRGSVLLTELQRPGRERVAAAAFAQAVAVGDRRFENG
ncbi:MAG: methionyl-tRNA formyltransferase [Pseudomonadota bacterium]